VDPLRHCPPRLYLTSTLSQPYILPPPLRQSQVTQPSQTTTWAPHASHAIPIFWSDRLSEHVFRIEAPSAGTAVSISVRYARMLRCTAANQPTATRSKALNADNCTCCRAPSITSPISTASSYEGEYAAPSIGLAVILIDGGLVLGPDSRAAVAWRHDSS